MCDVFEDGARGVAAGAVKVVDFEDASWFANLNTPEEFAEAERHVGALEP